MYFTIFTNLLNLIVKSKAMCCAIITFTSNYTHLLVNRRY